MTPQWCHTDAVEITRYVHDLQNQLLELAEPSGEQATDLARRLASSLDASLRMVLLEALSEAAAEITADLAPGSVEVRLRGREPEFVVTPPMPRDSGDAGDASGAPDQPPTGDYSVDGQATRTTLRLPEKLKTEAETAAAREGISVNTWLVRAVATALSRHRATPPTPPANTGTRFTGWVR